MRLRDILLSRGLSNREVEVVEKVAQGLSNKQAAERLFVTEKTVKFHLTNIYKKLKIVSRSQLIVWCAPHLDFIEPETEKKSVVIEDTNWEIPSGINKVGTA